MPHTTLVHIGYQKTGSTWLQTQFLNHPDLLFSRPFSTTEFKEKVILPHPFLFEKDTVHNELKQRIADIPDSEIAVISVESISGSFFCNGADGLERANRIKSVLPDASVLICIREQRAMLRSSYKHYIKAQGTLSLDQWLTASSRSNGKIPVFDPVRFQYHHLISHYQSLFGADNVLVLPFEQFGQSPKSYINQIAVFSGLPLPDDVRDNLNYGHRSNPGLSFFSARIKRHLNRLFAHDLVLNPKPVLPIKVHHQTLKKISDRLDRRVPRKLKSHYEKKIITMIDQWVGDRYQESNAITAELTGLNLCDYGYDLAESTKS
jgi:hypothetical protein